MNWLCRWRGLSVSFAVLASCSGTSDTSAPATPEPSSTPTASPTPTPSTYVAASDFARDRAFTGIGLRISVDRSTIASSVDVRLDPEAATIGFDFTAATRTYTARYLADTITAVTQSVAADPSYDRFTGPNASFVRSPLTLSTGAMGALTASSYVGVVNWSDNNGSGQTDLGTRSTVRQLLFGARTLSSDLPISGAATFTGQSSVTGPGGGGGGNSTLSMDYTARTVKGTTIFSPPSVGGTGSAGQPAPTAETITFAGTFDPATGRVTGVARHAATGAAGSFEGAVYGPAALEVALLFKIEAADGSRYFGSVAGRR